MTKIARLVARGAHASLWVPRKAAHRSSLPSRLKLRGCGFSETLSGFPSGNHRTSCPKEEPPEGREKVKRSVLLSLPMALLASRCPSRPLDIGTATCTPHSGITLGARPPYHLSPLSACPEEPAPLFSSLETRDTPSGTAEDTQVLQPGTQRHSRTWGHTRAQAGT